MTSYESFYAEKMRELQRQLDTVKQTINTNSKVIAFMNSPVGQYLDKRPFISLSLLVFIALSAVPFGMFLTVMVGTAVIACLGVIIIEGYHRTIHANPNPVHGLQKNCLLEMLQTHPMMTRRKILNHIFIR
ncbi:lipid droplet assembly factor 1 isoform X1 [Pyxicephalus adspersus]|uniref:lipid droplet assembly factor 1 isoform X1 n=1 Tax=Pyxicephalus adspersus TaxID=30357 RepID=UPI003B5CE78B